MAIEKEQEEYMSILNAFQESFPEIIMYQDFFKSNRDITLSLSMLLTDLNVEEIELDLRSKVFGFDQFLVILPELKTLELAKEVLYFSNTPLRIFLEEYKYSHHEVKPLSSAALEELVYLINHNVT